MGKPLASSTARRTPAEAYRVSSQDYNVGDLSSDCDDPTLKPFLEKQGVSDLKIEIFSSDDFQDSWTYDMHLVDRSQLPDEE